MAQRCNAGFLSQRPYGVSEGLVRFDSLCMPYLRLACMYRRRIMRNLAFDRHGCVAIVEGVSGRGEGGAIEVDSPLAYGV